MIKSLVFVLVFAGTVSTAAFGQESRTSEINHFLNDFKENSSKTMNSHLPKRDLNGNIKKTHSIFSDQEIKSGKYIEIKNEWRKKHFKNAKGRFPAGSPAGSVIHADDQAESVVDSESLIRSPVDMQNQNLTTAKVPKQPWSTDFWPYFKGLLGARFADFKFPVSKDWKANFDFVNATGRSYKEIVASNNPTLINQLSPAEKYDLLIGSDTASFTAPNWQVGRDIYESDGSVPDWEGICDGWVPASFMLDRPIHAITLAAANGSPIVFYPDDIKALASILWSRGSYTEGGFAGNRCNEKNPATDANGRIIDQSCFDTNPGTWHMAVVNQVGVNQKSFAMDATFDYEVWNQPVRGYTYTYFSPKTLTAVPTLAEATVALADLPADKFKKYRSKQAISVVGIVMDLQYIAENERPRPTTEDSESLDFVTTARYMYDLELDSTGKIIGGEWYMNAHPDFLWKPDPTAHAVSGTEAEARDSWEGRSPLPASWKAAAIHAAGDLQPLSKIVDQMIALSRQ